MKLGKFRISTYKIGKALYNNGTTRKMSQRYFCPAEYTLSLGLVLVFLLVWCTPLGKNIVGSFFCRTLLFSALLKIADNM